MRLQDVSCDGQSKINLVGLISDTPQHTSMPWHCPLTNRQMLPIYLHTHCARHFKLKKAHLLQKLNLAAQKKMKPNSFEKQDNLNQSLWLCTAHCANIYPIFRLCHQPNLSRPINTLDQPVTYLWCIFSHKVTPLPLKLSFFLTLSFEGENLSSFRRWLEKSLSFDDFAFHRL